MSYQITVYTHVKCWQWPCALISGNYWVSANAIWFNNCAVWSNDL